MSATVFSIILKSLSIIIKEVEIDGKRSNEEKNLPTFFAL